MAVRLRLDYLQHQLPTIPTSLTRRERIGASGMERLLVAIIDAALAAGVVKRAWRTAMRMHGRCDVRRAIERLKTFSGRVVRDIGRKIGNRPRFVPHLAEPLARVIRLLAPCQALCIAFPGDRMPGQALWQEASYAAMDAAAISDGAITKGRR